MITYIEKVNWLNEFSAENGNNNGYTYGINYVDFEDLKLKVSKVQNG